MQSDNVDGDRSELHIELARMRDELTILQRSFEESVASWKLFGFAEVRNPVAESIRRDIENREASLQRIREQLADSHTGARPA